MAELPLEQAAVTDQTSTAGFSTCSHQSRNDVGLDVCAVRGTPASSPRVITRNPSCAWPATTFRTATLPSLSTTCTIVPESTD